MRLFLFCIFVTAGFLSNSAMAAEPNFKCDIFGGIEGPAKGSLTFSGDDATVQTYELKIVDGNNEPRTFTGSAYLQGSMAFTKIDLEIQKAMMNAMSSSPRPNLTTGDLILFTNTKTQSESTINILLMPSGQIGYLQIGFLEVLCM